MPIDRLNNGTKMDIKAAERAAQASLAGAEALALSRQSQALQKLGQSRPALAISRRAMAVLDEQVFIEGSEEEILYTHYLLLEENGEDGSREILERAIEGFHRKLDALEDARWRATFSGVVKINRALADIGEETTE